MRASLLAISKYAPAGPSSNYIAGLQVWNCGTSPTLHKSPTYADRPRTMPELCPSHQIGSTPESLRILHLYTLERIASDSPAFSEPKQIPCFGLRGNIIQKFLFPALHVFLRDTLQSAKLTAKDARATGLETSRFLLAHDALSFLGEYLPFPQCDLHEHTRLSENHLERQQPRNSHFTMWLHVPPDAVGTLQE